MKGLGSQDPRRLGRNRMVAVIGRGAMGRVLLGQAPTGRLLAVKRIHPHLAADAGFRARFRSEVQASRQVTGAYTAAVVDCDVEAEIPWLATEYIPGPSLQKVLEQTGPLSLGGLRLLAAGLASALLEIHRVGLIHRDLKPANVLLSPDGPRVIDFGIARALEEDAQLTATGSVIGSPAFMSPEQAQGHALTQAADVFSVGAILATAATGDNPFGGTATPQVLYNIIYSAPDTARVPEPLRDIVDRCLAKDARLRPTPAELLDAIGRIEAEPVWPGAVRDLIAEQGVDARWWVETTAKHERYEAQSAALRAGRRRGWCAAAATIGALVLLAGTGVAVREWAEQTGHAGPVSDPVVALTGEEWRLLDSCALLRKSVDSGFGTIAGDPAESTMGDCNLSATDSSGVKRTFRLTVGGVGVDFANLTPSGAVAGWLPMYGRFKEHEGCERTVITQSTPRVTVEVSASVYTKGSTPANGCEAAEQVLRTVVERLAVNPPQLRMPRESIRPLDPCALPDEGLLSELIGSPAPFERLPTHCNWSGADNYLEVYFRDQMRPDMSGGGISGTAAQVGGATVYIKSLAHEDLASSCELTYMARPTTDRNAEVLTIALSNWNDTPGACGQVKRVFASLQPRLPE
ncbi:serine/threonine-protein kinase [Nocardia huaxiensis]|uniref:serine/threonine-protein kinase n=1 Tax=Nocardia huaxiensis TaxID=2755382 RepID=UPI001E402136|nr:serine/threonine-protein kinase [Nocardia huaxiensis]UFS95447.1 serine/threonine protein kinase [Nocardia huaxiensis]